MYEPKSPSPGLTVRFFVTASKLMKAGKLDVPYTIIAIRIGLQRASTIGYD